MHDIAAQSKVFKAYRAGTTGKKPLNKDDRTYYEVKDMDNFGAICNDGIVDISFDDIALSDQILNIIEETSTVTYALYSPHGIHTYWRINGDIKNGRDVILALGVKADIHNKGTYIPLKCDGVERDEIFDNITEIPELPKWLRPTKSKQDLWKMAEGDGRNDALSKHVFSLAHAGLSKEEIKEVYGYINKYILGTPLADDEMRVILRDETFARLETASIFDDKGRLKHDAMAHYIVDHNKVLNHSGLLYIYDYVNNIYTAAAKSFYQKMIEMFPAITKHQREEVYDYIRCICSDVVECDKRFISFGNGIYDLDFDRLLPHSPEYFITNKIKWNYNPEAYCSSIDAMLNKITCNDADLRAVLEEMMGYCMYRAVPYKKFFVLCGGKDNGKSTFIFALNNMLGEDNIAAQDIPNLEREYNLATLKDKLANIKDDIGEGYFDGKCASLLKQLIGGNRLSARNPYGMPFTFESYATLIFTANNMPKIKDTDEGALVEKLIKIPFDAHITKEDPDYNPNIVDELTTTEAMEYMVKLGVEGLKRVINKASFTASKRVENETEIYRKENNPVLLFIDEDLADGNTIENENVKDVYARYLIFAGKNPLGSTNFNKAICKILGLTTKRSTIRVNGKIPTLFVKS